MRTIRSTYALVIGIGTYHHLSSLRKTVADARDMHATLADSGYPATHIALLIDDQASKVAITGYLDWIARHATPDDTVVIFFSGHGICLTGGSWASEYLCPVEARLEQIRDTAISITEFSAILRTIPAGRLALFLDTCHTDKVGKSKDRGIQVMAGLSNTAYNQLARGRRQAIIASCRPEEISWELEGMRNGLFNRYLLEGLRGAAARPDGMIWLSDLFGYVYEHISRLNLQHPLQRGVVEDFIVADRRTHIPAWQSLPPTTPTSSSVWITSHLTGLTQRCRAI